MISQWKKLISLFLLLLLSGHSTLQAVCPCCTIHAILSTLRSVNLQTEPTCCQQHSATVPELHSSCCQTQIPLSSDPKSEDETLPCKDSSDCACCVEKPSFPNSGSSPEKFSLAFYGIPFELPSSVAIRNLLFDIPHVAPLPLQRRLALIAFWRN